VLFKEKASQKNKIIPGARNILFLTAGKLCYGWRLRIKKGRFETVS
jgi:hypothetical protein